MQSDLDLICAEFEASWKSDGNDPPQIERFLDRVADSERCALFGELLEIELSWRTDASLSVAEYHQRFPQYEGLVQQAWESWSVRSRVRAAAGPAVGHGDDLTLTYIVTDGHGLVSTLLTSAYDADNELSRIAPGTVLADRYRITAHLGQGGMGTVALGEDQRLGRKVAIKLIRADHWGSELRSRMQQKFEQEVRIGASLIHPAIAPIHDYGVHRDIPFAVFEYVSGQTLRDVIRNRSPLPVEDVLDIISRLAEALDYAHQKGIVHRDLKPENIRFDEHGQCKILDFGLATDFRTTADWKFAGTPAYASPEQATEQPSDGRTDQYALAAITYEMLTGQRVFDAKNWREALGMHRERAPASMTAFDSAIPAALDAAVLRALSKDPNDRFASCTEFALALGCHIETLPQRRSAIQCEAIVKLVPVFRLRDSFKVLTARRTCIALTSSHLWIATEESIRSIELGSLARLNQKGRKLTVTFAEKEQLTSERFKFRGRRECIRWQQALESALPEQPSSSSVENVAVPVLLKRRPNARMQLFGFSDVSGRRKKECHLALGLRAAMEGANVVFDVTHEKQVSHANGWRISGVFGRTVESTGRQSIVSGWFLQECNRTALMLLLFIPVLFILRLFGAAIALKLETVAGLNDAKFWATLAYICSLHGVPLIVVITLWLTKWPQLLDPSALSVSAMTVLPTLIVLLTSTGTVVFSTHRIDWQLGVLILHAFDPLNLGLIFAGLLLALRLLRLKWRYVAVADHGDGPSMQRRGAVVASWLVVSAYTCVVFVMSVIGGYTQAQLAIPGERERASAVVLLESGNTESAIDLLNDASNRNAKNPVLKSDLAAALLQKGELDLAVQRATEAIEIDPTLANAYVNRSAAYLGLQQPGAALADAEQAIQLDAKLAVAYINRAAARNIMGQSEAALKDAKLAIELEGEAPLALLQRGIARFNLGRQEEGVSDCRTAVERSPNSEQLKNNFVRVLTVRARHLLIDGDLKPAIERSSEAISLGVQVAEAHVLRATAYLDLGFPEKARKDADAALRIHPHDSTAFFLRGYAAFQLDDLQSCIEDCTRAIENGHKSAQVFLVRGKAYAENGQSDKARRDFSRAVSLDPGLRQEFL